MWRWLLAAALVAAGGPAAASSDGPASIIGGTTTTASQYPEVVALTVENNLCTGTLVAPTWIITAGHCIDPDTLGFTSQDQVTAALRVHFHTLDVLSDPGTLAAVKATFKHPQFNKGRLGSHDLGLVQLAAPVTDVQPVPINLVANRAPVGIVATVVGFGSTEQGGAGMIGRQFELANRTSVSCPTLSIGSDANLICFSQADNKGTCQGDSGGPAFATIDGKRTVIGVTSFGDPQCAEFGAETRIDAEDAFIASRAPELGGCRSDGDCPDGRACFARRCIAAPFSPTGLGTVCTSASECESTQCAESSLDGKRCSVTCVVSDETSCPDGFECLRAMDDVGACWPASGGCCDAGGAGGPGAVLLGIGVLGLVRRRRR